MNVALFCLSLSKNNLHYAMSNLLDNYVTESLNDYI